MKMKNFPLIIAVAGGALVFLLWKQRQAKAMEPARPRALGPSSVPQEWIEMTPEGYTVVGTSGGLYDILT